MLRIKYSHLRKLEKIFVIVALLLFAGAFIYVLRGGNESDEVAGDPLARVLFYGIYFITFMLSLRQWQHFWWVVTRDKWLLLLVGLALASVAWSDFPALTLRRSVALAGTTMFGIYFAMRFTLKEQIQLLAWVSGIIIISSILFALFLPQYGLMREPVEYAGSWQGVMVSKNSLGRLAALGGVVWLCLVAELGRRRWLIWLIIISTVIVILWLANSRASLLIFGLSVLLIPVYGTFRWRFHQASVVQSALALAATIMLLIVLSNLAGFSELVGRDATLTGRLDFWPRFVEMIEIRPWLGYGYNAFWAGETSAAERLREMMGWKEIAHAHNGFLEVGLDLGLMGMAIFGLGLVLTFIKAIKLHSMTRSFQIYWLLTYLTFILMVNLTESAILERNNIYWLLYVGVIVSTAIEYARVKSQAGQETLTISPVQTIRGQHSVS